VLKRVVILTHVMRETILSFPDDCLTRGDDTAVVSKHGLRVVRWSYRSLAETAFRFARELEARGIGHGDRVLFWSENRAEWIASFFGCLLRGAVVVPLDVQSAPDFAARVHGQVSAKLLLAGEGIERHGQLPPRLLIADLASTLARHSAARYQPTSAIAPDDLAEIIFTSGTTAGPKGVCLTHRNLLANLAPLEREINKYLKWERFFHPIRFLNLVPLSHVFGQFMGIFVPQLLGGEVHFQESLNPAEIIETVKRHHISVIVAVPRQLETLRDKIERDYEARGEGERLHEAIAQAENIHWLKRWWKFRRIHRRFGLKFWAFVAGGASLNSVNHPFRLSRGSIGKTLPGHEVKLSEQGEILVRGNNVAAGYWQGGIKPLTDDEGWLRTGDVGALDEAGNLYFKGRSKDVIVTAAGLNVYPEDLEAALDSQPEIRASAVVETTQGTEPFAALILRDPQADAEAAVRRANETLAPHQQIRHWAVWPEADFPRTPTQKIRKGEVKAKLDGEKGRGGDKERGGLGEGESVIGSVIARVSGVAPEQLKSSANLSTDLKLDSLGRVELLSALEDRYQVQLDEAAVSAATTVSDLERLIAEGTREATAAARFPYPHWAQRFPVTWIRLIVFYLLLLPLTNLMCRVRVRGREHLRGVRGPALFISNHVAMVDQSLVQAALPGRFGRKLAIAMEGEKLRGYRHP